MLAIATAALLVLATTAEAAFVKNDYGGSESYKHEDYDSYKPSYEHRSVDDYPEPSHKSHYADHKPSYEVQDYSHRSHHDSYEKDYGRDAYSVKPSYTEESSSPSYKQTHEPSYRYRRAAEKKEDYDEDGKDKGDEDGDKKGDGEGGNEPDEDEVSTETWVNLADSLSLIARKLADRDDGGEGGNGEEGDDDDDEDDDDEEEGKMKDDDEEEMKMSETPIYTYEPRKSKKYRKSHEPRSYSKYSKRSVAEEVGVTESQAMEETMDLVDGLREEQRRKNKCHCTTKGPKGHHKPCSQKFANTGHKYFCYVKKPCKHSKPSKHSHHKHWVTHKCCGKNRQC